MTIWLMGWSLDGLSLSSGVASNEDQCYDFISKIKQD